MAETATYSLKVDWNNDGDFVDAGETITNDLLSWSISRGFADPLARVAMVARAQFVLDNSAQSYSPPSQANVLPRRPVLFEMTYSGTTNTLFRGYLERIRPQSGQYRGKRCTLEAVDGMALLDRAQGEIALQTNVHADDVISAVVAACYTPASTNYQTGLNVFPTSGERWSLGPIGEATEQIVASRKILDICTGDWGKFFLSNDGVPTYYNRHQMPADDSTELTLSDTMLELDYEKAVSEVYNYIAVTCSPRSVGETNEVLGRLKQDDAPRIPAGDSSTFVVKFRDSSNAARTLGGKDCLTPVAGTDFNCTSDPGGEGTNVNGSITPSATFYADRAEITLANGGADPAYVQDLQVRGIAVRTREQCTMIAQDATSIAAYEKRKLAINAVMMSWQGDAQTLATWLLDVYKDPQDLVRGVQFVANINATLMAAARDLELLDKGVLSETQTGLSSYVGHIYAMRHQGSKSNTLHTVSLDLETAYSYTGDPFIVDTSTVDGPDVIWY